MSKFVDMEASSSAGKNRALKKKRRLQSDDDDEESDSELGSDDSFIAPEDEEEEEEEEDEEDDEDEEEESEEEGNGEEEEREAEAGGKKEEKKGEKTATESGKQESHRVKDKAAALEKISGKNKDKEKKKSKKKKERLKEKKQQEKKPRKPKHKKHKTDKKAKQKPVRRGDTSASSSESEETLSESESEVTKAPKKKVSADDTPDPSRSSKKSKREKQSAQPRAPAVKLELGSLVDAWEPGVIEALIQLPGPLAGIAFEEHKQLLSLVDALALNTDVEPAKLLAKEKEYMTEVGLAGNYVKRKWGWACRIVSDSRPLARNKSAAASVLGQPGAEFVRVGSSKTLRGVHFEPRNDKSAVGDLDAVSRGVHSFARESFKGLRLGDTGLFMVMPAYPSDKATPLPKLKVALDAIYCVMTVRAPQGVRPGDTVYMALHSGLETFLALGWAEGLQPLLQSIEANHNRRYNKDGKVIGYILPTRVLYVAREYARNPAWRPPRPAVTAPASAASSDGAASALAKAEHVSGVSSSLDKKLRLFNGALGLYGSALSKMAAIHREQHRQEQESAKALAASASRHLEYAKSIERCANAMNNCGATTTDLLAELHILRGEREPAPESAAVETSTRSSSSSNNSSSSSSDPAVEAMASSAGKGEEEEGEGEAS